jgi:diguanylate cyclase (GGDEF)-like protein
MTDNKPKNSKLGELFAEISQYSANAINDAVKKAIHAAAVDLYKKLEVTEDWLKADFSLAINFLEANDEWFAAQVSSGVMMALSAPPKPVMTDNASPSIDAIPADASPAPEKTFGLDSLSLVSKDDFEDWLTASMGIKFLESELSYELNEVTLIFTTLLGYPIDNKECAIGAEVIFTYLKQAIDELEIPPSPQAVIYKTVSRNLLDDLRSLYAYVVRVAQKTTLNYKRPQAKNEGAAVISADQAVVEEESIAEELVDDVNDDQSALSERVDVLTERLNSVDQSANTVQSGPSHSMSGQSSEEGVSVGQTRANDSNVQPHDAVNSASKPLYSEDASQLGFDRLSAPAGAATLDTLSRLNTSVSSGGSLGKKGGPQETASAESTNYAPSQLVSAISQLQQDHGVEDGSDKKNLRSWVEAGLNKLPGESLGIAQQESELIDVTDRFFEVVVDKIGVSGLLKKWLEKLKLTILKIVLRDKTFFSNASHPARQMLNKLAKLASNEKTDQKRLEKVLDRFIDRVVIEYDNDEQAIEKILDELNELLERQAKAQQRNSDRIARAYEGKQKVANARHLVVDDINVLLSAQSVPVVLLELLDKAGWREHLALVSVRDGHTSDAYKEALNVVDLLLNWLGEQVDNSDKWAIELEMELEAPSVLELVTKELSVVGLVGYEPILNRLEDCLFNDADPLLVKVAQYEWPYDKSEKEINDLRPNQDTDTQASHWHKRIVSMKVGDWVEIKEENGRTRCLRLAWSGTESFRFVFVDSQGMKDEDVTLNELVDMFKTNRACFVDHEEVSLVDQGLHQMVQSVYEELAGQSSCDVLTGLLNRQAFERGLEQSVAGAVTNNSKAALIYIDLDKFNLTNTNYGHHAGDALLKQVAEAIKHQGLDDAFCGRLGGNEFGMILTNCSLEKTMAVAQSICKEVANNTCTWEDHVISSTVSIGVSDFDVETDSYDTVMRKAGLACDLAKSNGRNRVVAYEEQDQDQQKRDEMLQWVQRLDGDLDALLTLRCQEIRPINEEGQLKSHYEILLGVRHEGQVLPPGLLIEAAEHFDRMANVDRWVIQNVLAWMENNDSIVAKSNGYSINLSGNSLSDDTFLEFILGQFAASTVPPEMICFEITETAAITNLADAIEFIRVLKQTGCKFSLDDFGSGLSSYAYIQKLPVDFIKIDGIFIRNIAKNEQDQALVKSINELAHFMGMKTVAEYVENHDILAVLRKIGVDHSQGFGIKKPILLEHLT